MKQSQWFWVKIHDVWFPAIKDPHAAGGWTNDDTWEDFGHEVMDSVEIPYPEEV